MLVTVRAGLEAPRSVRHELRRVRDQLGDRYDDVMLVLSELVTNSVLHGPPGGSIAAEVTLEPSSVLIGVTDEGSCFDRLDATGGGHGLEIVAALAEGWGVRLQDGCTVWAELPLTGNP
jgi:anti-sigma regulatory factor (Ser/Thr protein kinase)